MKTAFISALGLYQYTRVPFGYRNAPQVFMRLIDKIITDANLRSKVKAFVDDITAHGATWSAYLEAQREILSALTASNWLVTVEKMYLGYQSIELLGHLIEEGKIKPVPNKVEAINKLIPPSNTKQLKSFLGLVGFYRRFIKKFSNQAAPLVGLLQKNADYMWNKEHDHAFKQLKESLKQSTGLHLPSPQGRFRIYTDYSSAAISAILHQVQLQGDKEVEVPIAFSSRICRGKEKTLGSAEGELLAAVFALTKYKQYVGQHPFDLITDSRALCSLKSATNLAGKLARWSFFLEEFQINLIHKAGSTLQNADGLSRCATAGDS